jgi:hypothetical protein
MHSRVIGGTLLASAMVLASSIGAYAQTVPPGAAAPVPILPDSSTPPPATVIPAALADLPIKPVIFAYFGPYAIVQQILLPPLILAATPIGCWSAPNATQDEQQGAVMFGEKPVGSQFIAFFARGTRLYVFDVAVGNYCWIDNSVTRA